MKFVRAFLMLCLDQAFVCPKHIIMPLTGNVGRCNKVIFIGVDENGNPIADDHTFYVPNELQIWGKS